jgi:DNA-binding NtrC family response regulator
LSSQGRFVGWENLAKILIVEDEAMVLVLAESVLQDAGHETVTASNFTQAEAIIQSDQGLDLVFTDINLEDELDGGLKVGKLARVPVLYTSGKPLTDGMKELFAERSAFLPKPYTNHQVMDAVADLLK